jgi:hypothetical protein
MLGKITFRNLQELAEFLQSFSGSTAMFETHPDGETWVLEFTGGS